MASYHIVVDESLGSVKFKPAIADGVASAVDPEQDRLQLILA